MSPINALNILEMEIKHDSNIINMTLRYPYLHQGNLKYKEHYLQKQRVINTAFYKTFNWVLLRAWILMIIYD